MENLKLLTIEELNECNGGHNGMAYEAVQTAAKIVKYGKYAITAIGFFLS
ncbi:hypothetical protein [Chryseobacterium potabilaquae]|uniref:Uncharacterized protein n=1 Tax=Chryseobacterium potabilaquae TaxID=2675057 RepID=A0A6N4X5R5_9FLAO|nr:hypothetical protein [Chryseobacterium potabilaquae]CAA7194133.1 hypothetical protein CHRY9293_00510 [Chryseobacterium potabilaquae]